MQTDDFLNYPLIVFILPDNDEFARMRHCIFFGAIMKFVLPHFNCSIILYWINFQAVFNKFPCYFTANIFPGTIEYCLFGVYKPTLVVKKFNTI